MGRPRRQYPLGRYRLRTPKIIDTTKAYPVELEYTWGRLTCRKNTNIVVAPRDWNQEGNHGRGEVRASYGSEYKRVNAFLLEKVESTDLKLAEYNQKHPNQINGEVITGFLQDKPLSRVDEGKDLGEFTQERLDSDYSRNRIGKSRYENGKSCMRLFAEFLRSTKKGTYKPDGIYIGELTPELVDAYITWRRDIKQNGDETINHALAPILKASQYACELGYIEPAINNRIQNMRIIIKKSLNEDTEDDDVKFLTERQMAMVMEYYKTCQEPRRKEFLEMFMFAFHACGLRIIDVMTLRWCDINFEDKTIRKVMIKINKRHIIPLTNQALAILHKWREERMGCRFVFDLVKETLDLDNKEELYRARTNAKKCINQSLKVVGEQLGLEFPLTAHVARHTFAVQSLNKGMSLNVVSRLLGHGSTEITERVYAKFLPETLASELDKLQNDFNKFSI